MSTFDPVVPPQGRAWVAWLLRVMGWKVHYSGLPTRQGVIIVAPHTSNWDFVVGVLVKWAMGIPANFWAKNSLFRWPILGPWLRWLGGVPIDRQASTGMVGSAVQAMRQARDTDQVLWIVLTPEGTRSRTEGWRSGFYHLAHGADVPLGLAVLDFGRKEVRLVTFIRLSGDAEADMGLIAQTYAQVQGAHPASFGPVRLRG
ncbi:1-acyl-sn-glycerol-3-phosphate acyltransferase [Leptothrix ochracea]|uniref:1-acyl-sn-glycerol-3-phosphate acyltransferase n=1 Tax=Leptothrix ochracea TaxID=735331 RepID=UPI0034E20B71